MRANSESIRRKMLQRLRAEPATAKDFGYLCTRRTANRAIRDLVAQGKAEFVGFGPKGARGVAPALYAAQPTCKSSLQVAQ